MFNPKRFCGGAVELEIFLGSLRSNFRVHSEYFPQGDIDYVQYALDNLGSWSNHPEPNQRKTSMTDPISWGQDLLAKNSPCLFDFELFVEELRKQYGDKEWVLNTSSQYFTKIKQGHFDKNETVRAYAN
jgi:hypothetical protein